MNISRFHGEGLSYLFVADVDKVVCPLKAGHLSLRGGLPSRTSPYLSVRVFKNSLIVALECIKVLDMKTYRITDAHFS